MHGYRGIGAMTLTLHDYWRSGAAYRLRIALNVKGLDYCRVVHDLRTGAQRAPGYLDLAPQGLVPALEADGLIITQSLAIIEWLEECYPDPPLLPRAADERAIVRSMALLIACDVHPLNNLRVLQALEQDFGADTRNLDKALWAWLCFWRYADHRGLLPHSAGLCRPALRSRPHALSRDHGCRQ